MFKTLRAIKFLFTAPFILLMLLAINMIFTPGHWWIQWPAFGIGIAWIISLFRVFKAILIAGGIAAFIAMMKNRSSL